MDNTALTADLENKLCRMVFEFSVVFEKAKLLVGMHDCYIQRCLKRGDAYGIRVSLNDDF